MARYMRARVSDDALQYKLGKRKAVRYRIRKIGGRGRPIAFVAEVTGPFYSPAYGLRVWGATRKRARQNLRDRLGSSFNFFGRIFYCAFDEADNPIRFPAVRRAQ